MNTKVFVGGLNWGTTEDALKAAFSSFGKIESVEIMREKRKKRSRGFGFVTYLYKEAAQNACLEMDGTELEGRIIKVQKALEDGL